MTERDRYRLRSTWMNLENGQKRESSLGFKYVEDVKFWMEWMESKNRYVTSWRLDHYDACGSMVYTLGNRSSVGAGAEFWTLVDSGVI